MTKRLISNLQKRETDLTFISEILQNSHLPLAQNLVESLGSFPRGWVTATGDIRLNSMALTLVKIRIYQMSSAIRSKPISGGEDYCASWPYFKSDW